MGKKRIEKITRICNDNQRKVTLCKRKKGLLKKAIELSVLCDQRIFLLIQDDSNQRTTHFMSHKHFDIVEMFNQESLREFYTISDYKKVGGLQSELDSDYNSSADEDNSVSLSEIEGEFQKLQSNIKLAKQSSANKRKPKALLRSSRVGNFREQMRQLPEQTRQIITYQKFKAQPLNITCKIREDIELGAQLRNYNNYKLLNEEEKMLSKSAEKMKNCPKYIVATTKIISSSNSIKSEQDTNKKTLQYPEQPQNREAEPTQQSTINGPKHLSSILHKTSAIPTSNDSKDKPMYIIDVLNPLIKSTPNNNQVPEKSVGNYVNIDSQVNDDEQPKQGFRFYIRQKLNPTVQKQSLLGKRDFAHTQNDTDFNEESKKYSFRLNIQTVEDAERGYQLPSKCENIPPLQVFDPQSKPVQTQKIKLIKPVCKYLDQRWIGSHAQKPKHMMEEAKLSLVTDHQGSQKVSPKLDASKQQIVFGLDSQRMVNQEKQLGKPDPLRSLFVQPNKIIKDQSQSLKLLQQSGLSKSHKKLGVEGDFNNQNQQEMKIIRLVSEKDTTCNADSNSPC